MIDLHQTFPGAYIELCSCQIWHKIFFAIFPTFHFLVGGWGYVEHWSCQICHKKFCQISNSGRGGTSNFGHAKSAIKNFGQISNFSFLWGGGDAKLWSCQIWHKICFARFLTFHFGGRGGTSNFGHVKSAIKFVLPDFQLFISGGGTFELWSCQIHHKKILPDFQLFISGGGGGYICQNQNVTLT